MRRYGRILARCQASKADVWLTIAREEDGDLLALAKINGQALLVDWRPSMAELIGDLNTAGWEVLANEESRATMDLMARADDREFFRDRRAV